MVGTIIKREILEYLKSSKFLIGLLLTVVLITISTIINIDDYRQRRQDFLDASKNAERAFRVEIFREPQVLSTLVQGKDRKLGNRLVFSYMNLPVNTSGYMGYSSQHSRFFSGFAAVDFTFVVRVVLSLIVIFLAYNAVSEEKTNGTLKLTCANQIPRDQILLGKFLGGLFVILGSLVIATLVALLIFFIHPAIAVTGSIFLRILCLFGISVLYLVLFYTITLFVSVTANRSSLSLLILLQTWVFLIVIYPNLGVILSKQFVKLPTPEELADRKKTVTQPYEEEYRQIQNAFHQMIVRGEHDPEIALKNVEINAKQTELRHRVDVEFSNRLTHQMQVAQTISLLSPAVLYDRVMQRFSQTNIEEFDNFMLGVKDAWNAYVELHKLRYTDREAYKKEKVPEFTYPSESLEKSIVATLPQSMILFLFCIVFFALGYVKFLRKDVR